MVMVREQRDIEALVVWALRDQGLGWAGKDRPSKADETDYGTIIDTGSHPNMGLWSDDDAMAIKLAIDGLSETARALLVQYGRAGMRPDWCEEGYGRYEQARHGKRLKWEWSDPVNRTGTKRPKLAFVGEQRETVDYHRAQWGVWWQGLADIVAPLNEVMEGHEASGPAVERRPWDSDSAKPVVFGPDGKPLAENKPKPKVAAESVEAVRLRASAPIQAQANDWGDPVVPIRRKRAR